MRGPIPLVSGLQVADILQREAADVERSLVSLGVPLVRRSPTASPVLHAGLVPLVLGIEPAQWQRAAVDHAIRQAECAIRPPTPPSRPRITTPQCAGVVALAATAVRHLRR